MIPADATSLHTSALRRATRMLTRPVSTEPNGIFSTNLPVTELAHSIPELHCDPMSWETPLGPRAQARTALVGPATARCPLKCTAAHGTDTDTRARQHFPTPTLLPLFFLRSRIIFWAILLQRGTEPNSFNLDIMDRSLQTAGLSSLKRNLKRSMTGAQTSL